MGLDVLVDTDGMVDYLRGHEKAIAFLKGCLDRAILSAIVVAELYAGVKGQQEYQALNDVVSLFNVIPISSEIAKAGGLLKQKRGKSHGTGLADAIIAATVERQARNLWRR